MLTNKDMAEKKSGVIKITDASVEVMDQFLSFVYSGRLKDKRKGKSENSLWVALLPELVYVADKVSFAWII